jgi:hypothetical protein
MIALGGKTLETLLIIVHLCYIHTMLPAFPSLLLHPIFGYHINNLSIFGTNKVGKRLGLLKVVCPVSMCVMAVSVVVGVGVFGWSDVIHLQDVTALWAALNRAVSGHLRGELVYVLTFLLESRVDREGAFIP